MTEVETTRSPNSERLRRRTTMEELEIILKRGDSVLSKNMDENSDADHHLDDDDNDNDDDDDNSIGSLSTVEDLLQEDPLLEDYYDDNDSNIVKFQQTRDQKTLDVAKYMAEREMTPLQERMNAVTMIPNPIYCFYFIVASKWLSDAMIQQHDTQQLDTLDESQCITSTWFPRLYAMPPLTAVAIAFGITIHAPFSFLYHWRFASTLPPGLPRTNHWSRRMDQSFIHVASAFMAYGTTGNWDYFLGNVLFNGDCIYRQFKRKVRPRRNQIRIGLSILAYTFPILRRGDVVLFSECWLVLFVAGYFFVKYPLGGWSHSAFHLTIALLPPLLMKAAIQLDSSYEAIKTAAQCAMLAKNGL